MNVLSLFDGISVARQALHAANIPVAYYYCCEIDKYAIQVSKKNWSSNIHFGDVKDFSNNTFAIDLLIGGSPCQDLSIAKKNRKGLDGERSGLFWEYIRIKNLLNPKYFILENVASMSKVDRDIITEAMGVEPIMFNAGLVSAQCRKRLFWTNIKFELPVDNNILLKDILQPDAEVDDRMVIRGKSFTLTASYLKVSASEAQIKNSVEKKQRTMVKFRQIGHIGKTSSQGNRVYNTDGKSVCLSANGGGLGAKTGLYNVVAGVTTPYVNLTHGGQAHRVYDIDAKSPTLSQCSPIVKGTTPTIRKLTPIECERLQSLPDNYTEGISNTQRYKCLGNAFNCAVIQHILKGVVTP